MNSLYDSKCAELAEYFLADEPASPNNSERVAQLAAAIQAAVEDWFYADSSGTRQPPL
jgi:hypothetical protein